MFSRRQPESISFPLYFFIGVLGECSSSKDGDRAVDADRSRGAIIVLSVVYGCNFKRFHLIDCIYTSLIRSGSWTSFISLTAGKS